MERAAQETYRRRLTSLRARLAGDVTRLADDALRKEGGPTSSNLSNTPMHLADLGSDAFEEEMTLGLLENQEQTLLQVRAALARLDAGTYGRCEECGGEIGRERLNTLPHTPHCIDCARRLQAERGGVTS
jgi:RNA polymerase-binding transcription factor DksA